MLIGLSWKRKVFKGDILFLEDVMFSARQLCPFSRFLSVKRQL